MITALLIILIVLIIALWLNVMALWRQKEHELAVKTIKRSDVIRALKKAERLARRGVYTSLRYGKQATRWSEKKASKAFVAVFPAAKPAFAEKDLLTGLEHGPSSYFLASISKPVKKPRGRKAKSTQLSEE